MYLVTGGAGFIGSHVCDALLARGARVRVLDDLSTGRRENVPAGAELLVGDAADPAVVRDATAGISGCFHLAAIASVARGVEDWLGTHRANLTATITILDALRGRDVPVVYASSAAVYGDCPVRPIDEAAPLRPLSAYGADKLGCELHARVATHVHRVPTAGLRFFNVYGPRQDPRSPYSGVISIFCERVRSGRAVQIHGDGGQTRDFVFVADVVAALLAAMDARPADVAGAERLHRAGDVGERTGGDDWIAAGGAAGDRAWAGAAGGHPRVGGGCDAAAADAGDCAGDRAARRTGAGAALDGSLLIANEVYWVAASLAVPPPNLILIGIFGLILSKWYRRSGLAISSVCLVLMLLLSLPFVASRILVSLEDEVPRTVAGEAPQAIVVLSGETERVVGPGPIGWSGR